MGSSKKQTVGYRYYMGLHMGLCHSPVDAVQEIRAGDRTAWDGMVTGSQRIQINAPELFGGDEKEGGIRGAVDIAMGEPTQQPNDYLEAKIGRSLPAYRGILSLIARGIHIASNNPYVKPWAVKVRRILAGWKGGVAWYPETAPILLSGTTAEAAAQIGFSSVDGGTALDGLAAHVGPVNSFPLGTPMTVPAVVVFRIPPASDAPPEYRSLSYPRRAIVRRTSDSSVVWDSGWIGLPTDEGRLAELLVARGREDLIGSIRPSSSYQELVDMGEPAALSVQHYQATISDGRPPLLWLRLDVFSPGRPDTRRLAMNPAHIAYQCLTDDAWGMGYDESILDLDSFTAAADVFYGEGLGLCMAWSQQDSIESFLATVMDHAGAVLVEDRVTLKHKLIPIRGGYDIEALPHFSDALGNVLSVERLERGGAADAINELTVVYVDSLTGKQGTVTVQNLAGIQAAGRVIAQTRQYPGLPTAELALRVAMRDLDAANGGLARLRLTVNRAAYNTLPGGVIKLSWSKLGIVQMPLRVLDVDYGSLTDGRIALQCLQDVFGLPETVYVQPTPPPAPDDGTPPPAAAVDALEAPYRDLLRALGRSEAEALGEESGFFAALAARPAAYAPGYTLRTRTEAEDFREAAQGDWCPAAVLGQSIGPVTSVLALTAADGLTQIEPGAVAMIGTGPQAELIRIDSIDPGTGLASVGRGCIDTTPRTWPPGTRVWLGIDDFAAADPREYVLGETVTGRIITRGPAGALGEFAAPTVAATMAQRKHRPYPPGRLRITDAGASAVAYPSSCDGELIATWAHRDRILQDDRVVDEAPESIGPEPGTTYTVRWYVDGALDDEETGLTGTASTPYTPASPGIVRVQVLAVRDGLESWQAAEHSFAYGVGLLNGRITEDGQLRLVESGPQRILEDES